MAKVVLVTGVEGMVGSAVAEHLRRGGYDVVGTDQRIEQSASLGMPVYRADLGNVHALYGALVEHGCTAVVHCGAVSGPMLACDNPELVFQSNVTGTLNIMEAVRRLRLQRVVFCSSLMVYGGNDGSPLLEDSALLARDSYGASKIAAEAIVNAYAAQHGVDAVSARLAWIYGPRRQTPCAVRAMLQDAAAGRPTALSSGRSALRQYVHVDDVAAALTALLEAPGQKRNAYNVTGGDYRPFPQIVDMVRDLYPAAAITVGDALDADDPLMGPLSIQAITDDIGWTPATSLADGIRSYDEWLKARA